MRTQLSAYVAGALGITTGTTLVCMHPGRRFQLQLWLDCAAHRQQRLEPAHRDCRYVSDKLERGGCRALRESRGELFASRAEGISTRPRALVCQHIGRTVLCLQLS